MTDYTIGPSQPAAWFLVAVILVVVTATVYNVKQTNDVVHGLERIEAAVLAGVTIGGPADRGRLEPSCVEAWSDTWLDHLRSGNDWTEPDGDQADAGSSYMSLDERMILYGLGIRDDVNDSTPLSANERKTLAGMEAGALEYFE